MLVNFNPAISNNRYQSQNPNFTSLKDGKIVAEEVAKHTFDAEKCCKFIYSGKYEPNDGNLKALLKAKDIASTNPYEKISLGMRLDEAIEMLIRKAKEKGIILNPNQ